MERSKERFCIRYGPLYNNEDLFCVYYEPGFFWVRLLGYGIHVKNWKERGLIFSERMVKRSRLKIGNYIFKPLKPMGQKISDKQLRFLIFSIIIQCVFVAALMQMGDYKGAFAIGLLLAYCVSDLIKLT